MTLPGSLTTTYKYDALGRRIQRTTSAGADERYVYDGVDVIADLNSSSAVTTTYINGPGIDDHLRQTNTTTGVSYFLTDHLGTTAALTDSSGNVVETLAYDSFGNNAGSTRTRYTYTGRERDPDTGLFYYRARFYDPQLGRFISEDPIGFAGGDVNLYGYVWQNPLRFRDPLGLDGGWAPSDIADWADGWLERLRRALTGIDPDNVDANTQFHFVINAAEGMFDLLRLGRGFGHYYYGKPCTVPADELFADIGRAGGIILLLAGPGKGVTRMAGRPSTPSLSGRPPLPAGDNVVYRGLAPGESPSQGLSARAPDAGNSITSHIAGARNSQWISTTKSLEVAVDRFGQHGVVRIDLAKVNGTVVDVSQGVPGLTPRHMLWRWAVNSQEVLILNQVPAEAITVIK